MPRSLLLPPQSLSISSKPCSPSRTSLPSAALHSALPAPEGGSLGSGGAGQRSGTGQDKATHESELEKWLHRQVEFLQSTGLAPVQLTPQLSAPKLLKPPRSPLKSQTSNHVKEDVSQLLHIAATGPSPGSQKFFPSQSSPNLRDDKSITRWNQAVQSDKFLSAQLENHLLAPRPSSPQSVMVPSHGPVNDAMRVRNGGRRTSPRPPLQRILRNVQSEPYLGIAARPAWGVPTVEAWSLPSTPAGVETKTPRTVRGLVRRHSEVTVGMPIPGSLIVQRRAETPVVSQRTSPRPGSRHSRSPSPSPTPSRMLSQALSPKKSVTFADRDLVDESATYLAQIGKSSRSEDDLKQAARVKSKQLMGSLYDLRRVAPAGQRPSSPESKAPGSPAETTKPVDDAAAAAGSEKEQDAASPQGITKHSTAEQEKAETMMRSILRDVNDAEEPLRELEATLLEAHDPVGLLNGSRHATAVVSSRSLAVVSRKAHLCKTADARLKAFESAHARKELHFQEVLDGADVDEGLLGVKEFLSANVHQHCEPVDADKSSFQLFATTFGLPSKHHYIVKLRALHKESLEWWVNTCLQIAEEGVPSDSRKLPTISAAQIRRLTEVVVMISQNPKHPAVKKLEDLRSEVLTVEALHNSKKHFARDEMTVERSSRPEPDSAKSAAEAILGEITNAVAEGAPKGHWALKEAKGLEIQLRTEEKNRRAQVVNNYAVELDTKDQETAKKCDDEKRVPPVGPASEYADLIENAIQEVVKRYEVDEQHDLIKDAQTRAGTLRERDGERKRLAAREKRLAEQAAAKEQQQPSD